MELGLPSWHTCRCTAYLPIYDSKVWPAHNIGDTPDWWGDPPCALSDKPILRRQPRALGKWWEKYISQRERTPPPPPKPPWYRR